MAIDLNALYKWVTGTLLGYTISGVLALLIIVVGYFISGFIGWLTKWIIIKVKIEEFLEKKGRSDAFGGYRFSDIVATIVKWAIFAAFIATAADYLGWGVVSAIIAQISAAILVILYGAVIFLIGLLIADIAADYVSQAKQLPHRVLISRIVRGVLIILAADVALRSMHINIAFVETIILIIIAGLSLGAAIALGLAFGDALKPEARKIVEGAKEKVKINKEKEEKQ